MVYLDTGCLLKLHYPEPESAAVAAAVAGEIIVFTALHELEMVAAMQLKLFRGEGKAETAVDWRTILRDAARLAHAHAARLGCRSLDILHCTLAQAAGATVFVSSDTRQITLARAEGLRVLSV